MSQPTVFLTRPDYPPSAVQPLQKKFIVESYAHPKTISRDALLEGIKGKDALLCQTTDRIDKEVISAAGPQLKVIATFSLGYEHIDVEECKRRGIVVCNAPNPVSAGTVAEMTVGLMLGVGRRIVEASTAIQRGQWIENWNPEFFKGRGLINAVVGIVGMGRIGQAVLKRILPFDVSRVVYFDVKQPVEQAEALGASFVPFEELLTISDFVVVTCNLTPESEGMFDSKAFSLMKNTAVFVNTSRGRIVDQEALYHALKNREIKAAALDVMYPEPLPSDHKLVALPNVVLLPHISSAEENALQRLGELTAKNIEAVLDGKPPLTPV